jgi:hypothetical protein
VNDGFAAGEGDMALTTTDPFYTEHYQNWVGFTRLMRYVVVTVVIILALLGYFLA